MFIINARGEPMEFVYNHVEIPRSVLWRGNDLKRLSEYRLVRSILPLCSQTPRLLICLAQEAGSALFGEDLQLQVPVARLGDPLRSTSVSSAEIEESIVTPSPVQVFWTPGKPASESLERRLFDHIVHHGLLSEPFDRALAGLREVYERPVQPADGD